MKLPGPAADEVSILRAVRPADVASYLRARGWTLGETTRLFNTYVRGAEGGTFELEVPRASDFRDFHLRIAELLSTLSRVERRSERDVLRDLSVSGADVVRLRLVGTELENGSVLLEDGAMLIDTVHDLLLASACAAVAPRPFYGTRKPTEAVDFIRKVRLGQTEHGSFVVTVLSAVAPKLSASEEGKLFDDDATVPFERRVTETLIAASAAASRAAEEAGASGDLKPFESAVKSGASANFCDALARMLVERPYAAIEVSVGWSNNRPVPAALAPHVRVPREKAPLLAAASQQMKTRAPRDEFELEGYVVLLENENAAASGGTIVVAAEVDGGTRRVRLALPAQDYQTAIEAHRTAARVASVGRLAKVGRQYELQAVQHFGVVGDE